MRHLLNRQVLELKISPALDAFAIQNKISMHYWKHIIPMLNKVFDELSEQEGVIRIDEIKIDIGEIPLEYLDAVSWPSDFISQMEKKLRAAIMEQIANNKHEFEPTELSLLKQWLFYMREGYLPWNGIEWREENRMRVLAMLATDFASVSLLRRLIKENETALSRIVLQHDDGFLQKVVEILSAKPQQQLILAINEASELIGEVAETYTSSKMARTTVREVLWKMVISDASQYESSFSQLTMKLIEKYFPFIVYSKMKTDDRIRGFLFFQHLEKFYESHEPQKQIEQPDASVEKKSEPSKSREIRGQAEPGISRKHASGEDASTPASEVEKIQKNQVQESETEKNIQYSKKKTRRDESEKVEPGSTDLRVEKPIETTLDSKTEADAIETSESSQIFSEINDQLLPEEIGEEKYGDMQAMDEQRTEEGIYVTAAGIVLVHPFLQTLFRKLAWTENESFRNAHCRHKALHLLHYVATGLLQPDEYWLTVPKLLCGYPFRMPVPKEIVLADEELSEADSMIEAVIANWEVLKQTSPAGLREGFLQRNGRLTYKHEKIYLQLENKAMDVLLDHLPWNIGIIKLPWMKYMMVVDWR